MGLRTFTLVGGLLWYKCSPVCESPTQPLWIWFYCDCAPPTISLWLLLCLWMWGIFSGEFQCLPVDDCPAANCDSGVLARGCESTSFYSAILVPLLNAKYLNFLRVICFTFSFLVKSYVFVFLVIPFYCWINFEKIIEKIWEIAYYLSSEGIYFCLWLSTRFGANCLIQLGTEMIWGWASVLVGTDPFPVHLHSRGSPLGIE